jgi:hypothetical protein
VARLEVLYPLQRPEEGFLNKILGVGGAPRPLRQPTPGPSAKRRGISREEGVERRSVARTDALEEPERRLGAARQAGGGVRGHGKTTGIVADQTGSPRSVVDYKRGYYMRGFRTLRIHVALISAGLLLVTTTAVGQKKGGKQVDTSVTSTFGPGTIQDDGLGPYESFKAGKGRNADEVVSIIQTSNTCCNDWILDTLSSTSRAVTFDFGNLVPGTPDLAPFRLGTTPARFIAGGANAFGPPDFPDLTLGEVMWRPMWVRIPNDDQTHHGMQFNADSQPGTTFVRVTCDAEDQVGCSAWTIDNGGTPAIGRLFILDSLFPDDKEWLGDYYMTFSITVEK